MEWITKFCWLLVALIHAMPSLPLVRPGMIERMYGVAGNDSLTLLLSHRAALFATVLVLAIWAIIQPEVRRAASVVAALSMLSFLLVYARHGMPAGALRTVALVDLLGLFPLAWVMWEAWRAR